MHIIPKHNVDIEKNMNKMGSEKNKKEKERVKFQDYKETFNATAESNKKRHHFVKDDNKTKNERAKI